MKPIQIIGAAAVILVVGVTAYLFLGTRNKAEMAGIVPPTASTTSGVIGSSNPSDTGYDIIIVAGQSNAVGEGKGPVSHPGPTADGEDSRIFQVGRFGTTNMTVIPAKDPLAFWKNENNTGKGFALPFSEYYAQALIKAGSKRNVLIIPAAWGGTSILEWSGIIPTTNINNLLWSDMDARVTYAKSLPGSRVVAILWYQGAADVGIALKTQDPNHALMQNAQMYHDRLSALVEKFHTQYGPEVPFLIAQLSKTWSNRYPNSNEVENEFVNAISAVGTEQPNTKVVSTDGLVDNASANGTENARHLTADSQAILAQRLYSAFTGQ